jgi:hypothetical protein
MDPTNARKPITTANPINPKNVVNYVEKYFVPPTFNMYTTWSQAILVFIFLGFMFALVLYLYVYYNYNDYQTKISVIANAYLFGKNPQQEFQKYISNRKLFYFLIF